MSNNQKITAADFKALNVGNVLTTIRQNYDLINWTHLELVKRRSNVDKITVFITDILTNKNSSFYDVINEGYDVKTADYLIGAFEDNYDYLNLSPIQIAQFNILLISVLNLDVAKNA